jgi:hypothetical protein
MKLYKLIIEFSELSGKPPISGEFIAQDDVAAKKVANAQLTQFMKSAPKALLFEVGEEIELSFEN